MSSSARNMPSTNSTNQARRRHSYASSRGKVIRKGSLSPAEVLGHVTGHKVSPFRDAKLNIFQDTLALEYGEHPLAKYSVEWQPDDKHLLRVGNPRLYDHPYQSPQLELWPPGQVEWFVILKAAPYEARSHRKRAARILVIQPPLLTDGTQDRR